MTGARQRTWEMSTGSVVDAVETVVVKMEGLRSVNYSVVIQYRYLQRSSLTVFARSQLIIRCVHYTEQ